MSTEQRGGKLVPAKIVEIQIPKRTTGRNERGEFTRSDKRKYYDWLLEFKPIKEYANRVQSVSTFASMMAVFARTFKDNEEAQRIISLCESADMRGFKSVIVPKMQSLNHQGKGHYSIQIGVILKGFYNFINGLDTGDANALRWKKGEIPKYIPIRTPSQHVPTPEEVYRMADIVGATPLMGVRNKAILLFLFQSGCRSGVISNLTYGDVASCIDGYCSHDHPMNGPKGMKLPIYVKITSAIDTKLRGYSLPYYWTFLGIEAATAIKEYIEFRMRPEPKRNLHHERVVSNGGIAKDGSYDPLRPTARYRPLYKKGHTSHTAWKPEDEDILFMSQWSHPVEHTTISQIINLGADGIGIDHKRIWPHLLRKSFRKVIGNSDVQDSDWKDAVMGWSMAGVHRNYYDDLDVYNAGVKYVQCDFSRQGHGRIQDKIKAQDDRIEELEIRNKKLLAQVDTPKKMVGTFSEQFAEALEDPDFQRKISNMLSRGKW